MKNIIRQLLVFFVFVVSLNLAAQTLPVITGQVKCQGRGVANVVVTNGFDCVSTDVAGKYTIPYHRDARFVYVTTPAGYLPQRDGSLPLFYQRITKGTSVYDFSLVKNSKNDDKHLFLVQADVQLGKDEDVTAYSEYLRDVKEFVDKCSKYDLFMLDCGDIVGNAVSGLLANSQNGYLLGAAFFIVSFLFTQIMLNKAVYGIFIPIAIMTCQALGANPIGPILLCFSGSMSAILTPMATPAIPMAMAAGGYDQKSLFKQGWLISVLLCVGYIFFIMTVFPAF